LTVQFKTSHVALQVDKATDAVNLIPYVHCILENERGYFVWQTYR